MASLTARGNQILARVTLTRETPDDTLTLRKVHERAYRSDGVILSRLVVWFAPDAFNPKGRYQDYGWKVLERQINTTPAEWVKPFAAKGWEVQLS